MEHLKKAELWGLVHELREENKQLKYQLQIQINKNN